MVFRALTRQVGRRALIALTVALGVSLSTAILSVMWNIGDKVNEELKAYGANIVVRPQSSAILSSLYEDADTGSATLAEEDLGKIKTIFWAFNILDFAPFLSLDASVADSTASVEGTWFNKTLDLPTGEQAQAGMKNLRSWWDVSGDWLSDCCDDKVMASSSYAAAHGLTVGQMVTVGGPSTSKTLKLAGIYDSGDSSASDLLVTLKTAQELAGSPGAVSRIEVSALTTPDNDLARRAAKDPKLLSAADWETWYCTAYVSSIAYQLEEVIPESVARPVRQIAESEGVVLEKTQSLMLVIALLSLIGAAMGIANLITASVMERAAEIGLMKAIGGTSRQVVFTILAENLVIGAIGGLAGYFAGLGLAQVIGEAVFGTSISITPIVAPIMAGLVLVVIAVGSLPAIRLLLKLKPAEVLHGR
jgi:putative ABC transport system permease protein